MVVNFLRKTVANGRNTTVHQGQVLDVSHITPRLVAMSYPCEGVNAMWRNDVTAVRDYLISRHQSCWKVWNLTEHSYPSRLFYGGVTQQTIPDHHAPMLMQALDIVQQILAYLHLDPANVAVVHCLAGKGRTGTIISMTLVAQGYAAQDALTLFASGRGQPVSQPSQIRYVGYFEKLLMLENRRPTPPLRRLRRIELSHAPNYDGEGSWPTCVVENYFQECARVSTPHHIFADNLVAFDLDLTMGGDILIRMFHQGVPLFRCQFHTLFLELTNDTHMMEFGLRDLDEQDEQPKVFERRFNPAFKLRIFFDDE